MSISYNVGTVYQIEIDKLNACGDQPRKHFKNIDELKTSILQFGLIQPIAFTCTDTTENATFTIVAGERRVRAIREIINEAIDADDTALLKKFESIPAVFVKDHNKKISLVENIQREDLHPIELANALQSLKDTGLTQKDIAGLLGKKESTVSEIFAITKLDESIKDKYEKEPDVSVWQLAEAGRCSTPFEQEKLLEELTSSGVSQKEYKATKKANQKTEQDNATAQDARTNQKKSAGFNYSTGLRFFKSANTQAQNIKETGNIDLDEENRNNLITELEDMIANATTALEVLRG